MRYNEVQQSLKPMRKKLVYEITFDIPDEGVLQISLGEDRDDTSIPVLALDDDETHDKIQDVRRYPTRARRLGCAFRPVFQFIPVLIFRNSGYSTKFPDSGGTHVEIKSFQGKIYLLRNSGSGIPAPEFRREGPLHGVFYATCNEHSVRRTKTTGVNDGILLLLLHRTPPQAVTAAATAATA
jgi:hypothetical protein